MKSIYTTGQYLTYTKTWHGEDSIWKAAHIAQMLKKNNIYPIRVGEVGCGIGLVLSELSKLDWMKETTFHGYDISSQAIELAKASENTNITFSCGDPFELSNEEYFDVLLAIDVFEHVPDYLEFIANCRRKADYVIYHIPLDIHVSSVIRRSFIKGRYTIGHLHYFTAESAFATLKDVGHTIVDFSYTCAAIDLYDKHPSLKRACANVPRWVVSRFSEAIAAQWFGGYSLLVIAKCGDMSHVDETD